MKISSQSRGGDYFELEIAEDAYQSDEAGALWLYGHIVRFRNVGKDAKAFELRDVDVRLRVDGFGVAEAVRKAVFASSRRSKSGACQVFLPKEPLPWKEVES